MKRMDGEQGTMFYTDAVTDNDVLLCFTTEEEWLSRRQIAERLWRKVTPGLTFRIEVLVRAGSLEKRVLDLANGQVMFWYRKGATCSPVASVAS